MTDTLHAATALSNDARALLDYTTQRWPNTTAPLGISQWLLALIEYHDTLVTTIAPAIGNLDLLQQRLDAAIQHGEMGDPLDAATLHALAGACAHGDVVTARTLAGVILTKAGYAIDGQDAEALSDTDCDTIYVSLTAPEQPASTTPLLDELGIDLTRAAREGALNPVVGRDDDIALVIETLCRSTKRNPALLGPAGVGKTAIVEGVAQRVVRGDVPPVLGDLRIVMLSVTALVANCTLVGEFEARMTTLLQEARQPGVVLFIDEAHTMLGAGAAGRNGNDLANMLKPALARGEIACIAATTDEEYRQYIEPDSALERRFQPIRVQELTAAETLVVLASLRERFATRRGITVPGPLLEWMVTFAEQHMHNRYFPDKAIDILEQCVAYGLSQGKTALTQADVEAVAQRMVGMPIDISDRLAVLSDALHTRCLLPIDTVRALLNRLEVTLRGVDFRAARPNGVLLLIGEAATQGDLLSEVIAESLFGTADRVISLDLSRLAGPADLSMLLGSPPGYVGYGGRVPLHQVMQMPWCVLHCDHLEVCHPVAREVLTEGLRKGCITLADGKRVFLSDTLVILSAAFPTPLGRPLGFGPHGRTAAQTMREELAEYLGDDLLAQVDVLCCDLCLGGHATQRWLRDALLPDLHRHFRPQGVHLCCDHHLLAWLSAHSEACPTPADWERLVENELCPLIIPHLPGSPTPEAVRLHLSAADGRCVARRCPHAQPQAHCLTAAAMPCQPVMGA